jgi:hypothetical protein
LGEARVKGAKEEDAELEQGVDERGHPSLEGRKAKTRRDRGQKEGAKEAEAPGK